MMRDHQRQELPIKGHPGCASQSLHLFCRRHAAHSVMLKLTHRALGILATLLKPLRHKGNFVILRRINAPGYFENIEGVSSDRRECGHGESLSMVRDHILHESHVTFGVTGIGDSDRLFSAEVARNFTWRARLNHRLSRDRCIRYQTDEGCESEYDNTAGAYSSIGVWVVNGRQKKRVLRIHCCR